MDFYVLCACLLAFALLLLGGGVAVWRTCSGRAFALYVVGVVLLLLVLAELPLPMTWFFADYNADLDDGVNERWIDGVWVTVWRDPRRPDVVRKVVSAPGVSHTDFTHVALPTTRRMCERDACTLPAMLAHRLATGAMMKSARRIRDELADVPYFARILDIDEERRIITQEFVPYGIDEVCPADMGAQLAALNAALKARGFYIDDVHSKNVRVAADGTIKVIDAEVYTDSELVTQQMLLDLVDGSQDGKAKGYANADRVLHWQDGRPSAEDYCRT